MRKSQFKSVLERPELAGFHGVTWERKNLEIAFKNVKIASDNYIRALIILFEFLSDVVNRVAVLPSNFEKLIMEAVNLPVSLLPVPLDQALLKELSRAGQGLANNLGKADESAKKLEKGLKTTSTVLETAQLVLGVLAVGSAARIALKQGVEPFIRYAATVSATLVLDQMVVSPAIKGVSQSSP